MNDKSSGFVREFINIYRLHPALWKVNSKVYTNRTLRDEGYSKLLQLYKTVDKNATTDTIRKKINNLRCAFRKELKKARSQKCGATMDKAYTPSLWYYKLLLFTANQKKTRVKREKNEEGSDDAQSNESEVSIIEAEIETRQDVKQQKATSPVREETDYSYLSDTYLNCQYSGNSSRSHSRLSDTHDPLQLKRKLTARDIAVERTCLGLSETRDEFDIIGENVAFKLRKMDPEQMLLAEQLISNILFSGLQRKLSSSTDFHDANSESFTTPTECLSSPVN